MLLSYSSEYVHLSVFISLWCSRISVDFVSPFDATVVKLLRKAGADIIGKTNCDEFGMGCARFLNHTGILSDRGIDR